MAGTQSGCRNGRVAGSILSWGIGKQPPHKNSMQLRQDYSNSPSKSSTEIFSRIYLMSLILRLSIFMFSACDHNIVCQFSLVAKTQQKKKKTSSRSYQTDCADLIKLTVTRRRCGDCQDCKREHHFISVHN